MRGVRRVPYEGDVGFWTREFGEIGKTKVMGYISLYLSTFSKPLDFDVSHVCRCSIDKKRESSTSEAALTFFSTSLRYSKNGLKLGNARKTVGRVDQSQRSIITRP